LGAGIIVCAQNPLSTKVDSVQKAVITWRSLLYVPANVERFIDKASSVQADAIIVDLEDSVPPEEKTSAREKIREVQERVAAGGAEVLVRINRPWRQAIRDLEACVWPGLVAVMCPKVESADQVRAIAEILGELEEERSLPPGSVKIVPLVESAAAYFRLAEIASANVRLVSVMLGTEDLAAEMGVDPSHRHLGLGVAKHQVIMACRMADLEPLGFAGSITNYRDLQAFEELAHLSRAMGFSGSSCIHPVQVPILNRAFSPSQEEIDWANEVISSFESAVVQGRGSVAVHGAMVDVPIYRRALRISQRAKTLEERSMAKQQAQKSTS
jgi:citrate lyase subunit beta/citryl-CoA lyase